MNNLDTLIKEGNALLQEVIKNEDKGIIEGELMSKIKSLHIRGRFYLKKIDKEVFKEYSELFSNTFGQQSWDRWNTYTRTELEKCIGFFLAINSLNPDEVIDKTLNKVFISHGKFTPYFSKIELFIRALGLIPVYDANEPTQGKTINTHVSNLMANSDFYVILATKETTRDNQILPNHNVIIEYDRLIQANHFNLIVLLEEDCKMPSMMQDVIYVSFNSETLSEMFTRIASELNSSGLIN